jgi:hypothetical protein
MMLACLTPSAEFTVGVTAAENETMPGAKLLSVKKEKRQ